MDDGQVADKTRDKLRIDMKNIEVDLIRIFQTYNRTLNGHYESMQRSLHKKESYFKDNELYELHEKTKNEKIDEVRL